MEGPVVWITGAGSGIGLALAVRFHRSEWAVAVSSRSATRLKQWGRGKENVVVAPCDVRRETDVRKAYRRILTTCGFPDVVVNAAGVTIFQDLTKTRVPEFREIIDTNLTGPFIVARTVVPAMRKRRSGTIVNILSYAAKTTYTRSGAYAASKAGADALMRVLRNEVRDDGVRVLNVFPGAVDTAMWPKPLRQQYAEVMMTAAHVADLIFTMATAPADIMPEEFVLRPQIGDLRV